MKRIITIETDSHFTETILSALRQMKGVKNIEINEDISDIGPSVVNEPQAAYECTISDESSEKRKQEILDGIREALQEVKLAREGKIELQSARDFLNELRD